MISTPEGDRPCIDVLIGNIGSGKSTYAKQRVQQGALVVSFDGVSQLIHPDKQYDPNLAEVYREIEGDIVRRLANTGRDIVIDRCNLKRDTRARWLALGASLGMPVVAVVLPIYSVETHARQRFFSNWRNKPYTHWLKIAQDMEAQRAAEPLTKEEPFDMIQWLAADFQVEFARARDDSATTPETATK